MGIHILFLRLFWRKTTFIYHIQDLQIDAALELGIIKYPWIRGILLKIENLILEKSTVVSTISEGMRKKILAKSELLKDVFIMPNWVDDQLIYTTEIKYEVISNLGIPLDKKVFFYSGAIGEKQGLDSLLIVAKKLITQCPDLLFVISGTGPFKKKLEKTASIDQIDNIKFIDLQPNEVFNQLLNYASCHLIIQKKQGTESFLPSKLGAILAVGGLSIVTAEKETSLYDIVQNNNLGIVIEPENEDALYESIVMVYNQMQNPEESAQIHDLKNNAKSFAIQYLHKESIIDSFMSRIKETRQINVL
jgi:colanic acid biosynthesis glycosyl transferase WcaI